MCYENIEKSLSNLILRNRCPQSFIFYGKNFSEIERIAKEFAFKILGRGVKNFRDIFEFRCDKKIISVEDVRMINFELLKKPEISESRVILIYDADKMTNQAQNSFLKSLEDSLENVFIILIVTNIKHMIDTLLSRCLLVNFGKISILEYKRKLKKYELTEKELENLYLQTKSDVDITKFILEKSYVYKIYLHIMKLFEYLSKNYLMNVFEFGSEINKFKDHIDIFLQTILEVVRDIFVYKEINDRDLINSKYFIDCIVESSKHISISKIYNILEAVCEFRSRINLNLNLEMCYKIFIFKIMEG